MNIIRTKSGITATLNPKGAELVSLKNSSGKEYIWEGHPDFWGKHSPVLFPIVGTLKNNTYTFNGKSYHLPRHGFARDLNFNVLSETESSIVFSLTASPETLPVYPFDFELQLVYTLTESGLEIGYKVFNKNEVAMPFSIGAHPAFALPGNFSDYVIEMEKNETLQFHLLEDDLISEETGTIVLENRKFSLDYKLFENDALVFKKLQSNSLTILRDSQKVVKIDFADFPNLGIWTKQDAPFLCIEPWFGYADTKNESGDIAEKESIQILAPNATFQTAFHIEIF